MDSKTKVIIAGAGIAGSVLAIFLKLKGYEPVVYEKIPEVTYAGLALLLSPNGLRVLNLIPGLLDKIRGLQEDKFTHTSTVPDDEGLLIEFDFSTLPAHAGFGLLRMYIVWGHQLVALDQHADHVEVAFVNGTKDAASFVVGCDGLHSDTRVSMFGREEAGYTGLSQTGGVSPIPEELKPEPRVACWYGDGAYMLALTMPDNQMSWAFTMPEPEEKETWRATDKERKEAFQACPWSQWPLGARELVHTAKKIYGLYGRPELSTWHKGRVILVGDAAHPTSPHLGRCANQAFEDIYHLVRLLVQHNTDAAPPPSDVLAKIFEEYCALRVPRTSRLVKEARAMGESNVVQGIEACKARNAALRAVWSNKQAVMAQVADMYLQPFVGQGEI
ncbi:FAD/NAD(P)-binding domain-containing protein [Daedalea quercina L-15889]|uniref:FAD/NAD(P)-binding domain-containing protein n=1 Tax=Daedalea quercina L-15889 TaxID=1314783 RepID=A0A165RL28_9APHY|nr:FAD/NAD(P)-binding domain-containing protein [Daedalea quercina L-15889]